jgi:hypothetical protein
MISTIRPFLENKQDSPLDINGFLESERHSRHSGGAFTAAAHA